MVPAVYGRGEDDPLGGGDLVIKGGHVIVLDTAVAVGAAAAVAAVADAPVPQAGGHDLVALGPQGVQDPVRELCGVAALVGIAFYK